MQVLYLQVIAGAGFEPATSGLWARRATRLLYPAVIKHIYYKNIIIQEEQKQIINFFLSFRQLLRFFLAHICKKAIE